MTFHTDPQTKVSELKAGDFAVIDNTLARVFSDGGRLRAHWVIDGYSQYFQNPYSQIGACLRAFQNSAMMEDDTAPMTAADYGMGDWH